MPAFSLDTEQTTWCAELRTLAAEHLKPLAERGEPGRVNRPLVAALGDLGLLSRLFEAGALDLCLLRESLARVCTEAETALALQGLGTHPVAAFGTPAQRAHWLPGATAGRAVAAFALSEPGAGSDAAALALDAVPDGHGGWHLHGEKRWISNAPEADFATVFARTTPGAGSRDVTAFLVPADRPAFGGVLADLQAVSHRIAEMATRTEAARLLVHAAASAYDRGDPDVPRRSAMAKLLATETAQYVVDSAVQLHGAAALQRGHLLEHLYREVRAPRIYEGATEVQRTIIARDLYARHHEERLHEERLHEERVRTPDRKEPAP